MPKILTGQLFQVASIEKNICLTKGPLQLDGIATENLPQLLENFYVNSRTKKIDEYYHVQSLRAGINQYLPEKIINIIDAEFAHANKLFREVQIQAKKAGKAVHKSTPIIIENDMEKLAFYVNMDHVVTTNLLQKL